MDLIAKIFSAGVVGAGGAGFPTHIKAGSNVEVIIANGAECEPLLHKDYELMLNFAPQVAKGMELMFESVKAQKGYFGIKRKNIKAAETIEKELNNSKIQMHLLGDFYPAGDEYELVYETTKRLIPPHGIPLDVGCVVNNVETFYNIANADEDKPVTKKIITVGGAVKKPSTFFVPVGTSFEDVIKFAGGASVPDFGVFVSGIMMGKLSFDLTDVITKTIAGLIVLPKEHYLIKRMQRPVSDMNRIGKSACDQCTYCTEFCPRYLLGYEVQPHKVMRSLVFTTSGKGIWNEYADLCCSCGLCTLYACPEDLYPREACNQSQEEMKSAGKKHHQQKIVKVHPVKDGRKVPSKQLMKKLNITEYNMQAPFLNEQPDPAEVKIPLKQHVGISAKAIVQIGQYVKEGELIGEIPEGKLGAKIHSSIRGKVTHVNEEFIRICR